MSDAWGANPVSLRRTGDWVYTAMWTGDNPPEKEGDVLKWCLRVESGGYLILSGSRGTYHLITQRPDGQEMSRHGLVGTHAKNPRSGAGQTPYSPHA